MQRVTEAPVGGIPGQHDGLLTRGTSDRALPGVVLRRTGVGEPLLVVAELAERAGRQNQELRIRGYRDFVAMLTDVLPSHIDPDRAADILITMTSPQLYLAFRHDRGWSHPQTVDWMTATIPDLVLRA